jgi:VWFA-related protein
MQYGVRWPSAFRTGRTEIAKSPPLLSYLATLVLILHAASGQTSPSGAEMPRTTIRSTSTLVIVPAVIRSAAGELVTELRPSDFRVTDNGTEQHVFVEQTKSDRLAMVVVMQTGGAAAGWLQNYSKLDSILEKMLSGTTGALALVTFGSRAYEIWPFPPLLDGLYYALTHQEKEDNGAAILDAVSSAIRLIELQPTNVRRIALLLSQEQDHGSESYAEDILRLLGKSNTTVYSLTFSTNRREKRSSKRHSPAPSVEAISNALRTTTAQQLAMQSGGESATFRDQDELEKRLLNFADDIQNEYILSFRPSSRDVGLHMIRVEVVNKKSLRRVAARTSYWVDGTVDH